MKPDRQRIRIMTRLAIREQENKAGLRMLRESFRSDYRGIPMVKNSLRMTLVFLLILGLWAVSHIDFLLNVISELRVKYFLGLLGILYGSLILVTCLISFWQANQRYQRDRRDWEEYCQLLELLKQQEELGEYEEQRGKTGCGKPSMH